MVTADARPWREHQQFRRILSPTHRRNCEPPQQHRPRVNNSPNSNNKSPTTTTAQHFGSSPVAGHHGHYLFLQRFQEIFYRDRQDPGGIFDTVLFRFFPTRLVCLGGLQSGLFRHPPYRPIGAGALPTFNREPHSAYLSNRTPLLGAGTKNA